MFFKNDFCKRKFHLSFSTKPGKCTEDEYMEIVDNYIEYYCLRAHRCKIQYYTLNIIRLVALALVPVLEILNESIPFQWTTVLASSIAILMEGIIVLWRVRKKWALYRDTYNRLLRAQRKYMVKRKESNQNADENSKEFDEFFELVESIIQSEGNQWKDTVNRESDSDGENAK